MNHITIETLHDDPRLGRRLHLAAQRERAIAVGAGLVWLRERLAHRVQGGPARWLTRIG